MFSMKKDFTKQDFYDMLRPNGDCLEWTGAKTRDGYGLTRIDRTTVYTHRLALELEGINVNKLVLHSCDNPSCCNPAHLRIGTHQDNMNDMHNRNRANKARGERASGAKLTEQDVHDIRHLRNQGLTLAELADRFSVTNVAIHRIVHRKSWTHI